HRDCPCSPTRRSSDLGQLAGYEYVHDAVNDGRIATFVREYLEHDAAPTLDVPPGFDLPGYIDGLFGRLANPAVADTLARLSADRSEEHTSELQSRENL